MKLTKTKLRELVLEELEKLQDDEKNFSIHEQQLSTLDSLNRYRKAIGQRPYDDATWKKIQKNYQASPEFKKTVDEVFAAMVDWEKKGMPDLSKGTETQEKSPKTAAKKHPRHPAQLDGQERKAYAHWFNQLRKGLLKLKKGKGLRNLQRDKLQLQLNDLLSKGWKPSSGLGAVKKINPKLFKRYQQYLKAHAS